MCEVYEFEEIEVGETK